MQERKRIGLREVKGLAPGETIWDATVAGFCARRQTSAAVAYCLKYRTADGRQRWHTIGRHGAPWTPEEARNEAKRLLGQVVDGADPAAIKKAKRSAESVKELCDRYLEEAESGRILTRRGEAKKPTTLTTDRSRISAHILPLLGSMKVPAVTRHDVEVFMHRVAAGETQSRKATGKKRGLSNVRGGKGASSRTVGLLGAIFSFAVRQGLRPDNPVHGVVRYADGRKERRLSEAEYRQLGPGPIKRIHRAELA
ncbi:integrase arm-type DNA-binding domain-containing protein [Acidisoma sp. 7E03]